MASDKIILCKRCILDSKTPGIRFNENGICNYCDLFDMMDKQYPLGEEGKKRLNDFIEEVKRTGKRHRYDCIVGVSGGTDSTYTLLMAKKLGLRPLAVHFDNGWNSELSVTNIKNALEKLDVELYTYVVNWEEFKDLQLSFLKASTIDVEIPTDMAINKVFYEVAAKEKIKYVLSGISFRTEGNMPKAWGYGDGKYMKSVQKMFGTKKLQTFPNMTIFDALNYSVIRGIKIIRFLNFFDYSKEKAAALITRELGWQDHGGHHFESIYTRFFQRYISPVKFGVDRRKVSFSAQVRAGQMTREQALEKLNTEDYGKQMVEDDKNYIARKLGLSSEQFEEILARPPKRFLDYPTNYPMLKRMQWAVRIASQLKLIPLVYHETKFSE